MMIDEPQYKPVIVDYAFFWQEYSPDGHFVAYHELFICPDHDNIAGWTPDGNVTKAHYEARLKDGYEQKTCKELGWIQLRRHAGLPWLDLPF